MKIYKKDENLVIEVPLMQDDYDALNEPCGQIENICGVIIPNPQCSDPDTGFAYVSSRTYKGAEPDICGTFLNYGGTREEFIKLCESLDISWHEYPGCVKCHKPIYGSHTWDGGSMCFKCDKNL